MAFSVKGQGPLKNTTFYLHKTTGKGGRPLYYFKTSKSGALTSKPSGWKVGYIGKGKLRGRPYLTKK